MAVAEWRARGDAVHPRVPFKVHHMCVRVCVCVYVLCGARTLFRWRARADNFGRAGRARACEQTHASAQHTVSTGEGERCVCVCVRGRKEGGQLRGVRRAFDSHNAHGGRAQAT